MGWPGNGWLRIVPGIVKLRTASLGIGRPGIVRIGIGIVSLRIGWLSTLRRSGPRRRPSRDGRNHHRSRE
jgi:hypothetical protein